MMAQNNDAPGAVVFPAIVALVDFLFEDEDDECEAMDDVDVVLCYGALFMNPRRTKVPRTVGYAEVTVPAYRLDDFRSHFRMTRATFETASTAIYNEDQGELPEYPSTAGGRPSIAPEKHLLVTLWYLGNISCIRDISDRFDICDYTVWKVIRRISAVLCRLAPTFIQWPHGYEAVRVAEGFEKITRMPGCIGSIDGRHIEVKSPANDMDSYLNRLNYYSIVLQGVCDNEMIFTNCFTGYAGSVHDARVLWNSTLALAAANHQNDMFPLQMFIIGDSAYPLQQWLMVPVKRQGPQLTQQQTVYNDVLARTRKVVERAFRLLKCRWRRLQLMDLNVIEDYPRMITASCVLHNICRISDTDDVDYLDDGPVAHEADGGGDGGQGPLAGEADIFNPGLPANLRRQQIIHHLNT